MNTPNDRHGNEYSGHDAINRVVLPSTVRDLLVFMLLLIVVLPAVHSDETVILTVHDGARQTYKGFGFSPATARWENISTAQKQDIVDLGINTLRTGYIRLWIGNSDNPDIQWSKDFFVGSAQADVSGYLSTGLLPDIYAYSIEQPKVVLAVEHKQHGEHWARIHNRPGNLSQYVENIARLIEWMEDEQGIEVYATNLENEPSTTSWTASDFVNGVTQLRQELDSRGLEHVNIISPDLANGSTTFMPELKADSNAWNSTHAISHHSYNMAAKEAVFDLVKGTQVEYWQTESSEDPPVDYDDYYTPTQIARYLNDLNHGVNIWFHFIGWGTKTNSPHRLIYADVPKTIPPGDPLFNGPVTTNWSWHYISQLHQDLQEGAVCRYVTSSLNQSGDSPDMTYSYGQKPALNAASAVNPDGSWMLAVVNDTNIPSSHYNVVAGHSQWYPATTYQVTFDVQELAGVEEMPFTLKRIGPDHPSGTQESTLMQNGTLTVTVKPWEFVTLLSQEGVAVSASSFQAPNTPQNVLDGDLNTRWSAYGDGEWIQIDLGYEQTVSGVSVAFVAGDERVYDFDIQSSLNGVNWATLLADGESSGLSESLETFEVINTSARYVRITGHGSSHNLWNNYSEVVVHTAAPEPGGISATASSHQEPNTPENTLDDDLGTRWSTYGSGEWIQFDLGQPKHVGAISIAFMNGISRSYGFDVSTSQDLNSWTTVLANGTSSGNSNELENFDLTDSFARYIRITGHGSNANLWNNYTEVRIHTETATHWELESGSFSGATVESTHAGYSGTGYINYGSSTGSYAEVNGHVDTAGAYTLEIHYALTSGSRSLQLSANGSPISVMSFPATGSWTTWENYTLPIVLNAGATTLRLMTTNGDGPNVDRLSLSNLTGR